MEINRDNATLEHTLHILYAEKDLYNDFNKTLFSLMSKSLSSSFLVEDILAQYRQFYKKNGYYFDIVIIDNDYGIELLSTILDINPNQKILVNIKENSTQSIDNFYFYNIKNFIHEPLDSKSIYESILKLIFQSDENKFLLRNMQEYEKLDNNSSQIIRQYETKLMEMENKLKTQSDFFASMSHEIRTPMNAIIGMSQILIDDKSLINKQLKTAKTINNSSNMLVGIINDILDYSKIEAGMLHIEHIPFELNRILDYLADMMALKIKEKDLDLVFDIQHNIKKSYIGDSLRVSQILLNLISNAVKFTDKGSILLKITSIEDGGFIQFEIRDTGIGIEKNRIDSLFENYTQAGDDTSRKYGGTGLGLSISKHLANLMGGDIWVESDYGKGSSFFVKLKLELATQDTKRRYRLPSKDLMNKKVLVLDTRDVSLNAIKYMLEYFHYDVTNVITIEEARKNLTENYFDILFVDQEIFALSKIDKLNINNMPHIVIMEDWIDSFKREESSDSQKYKYLKRPYNQQIIFEVILDIYNYEIEDKTFTSKKYTKEDLNKLPRQKILLAEDNHINQAVIIGLLDGTNIEVFCANNGARALDELFHSSYSYKLILMDINMPHLNGYETTQRIRKDPKYKDLVIVALSGDTSAQDIQNTKDAGMQEYLTKPIDISEFYKTLFTYLKG